MRNQMRALTRRVTDLSLKVASDRRGVTAVEYGVIAALIIVVCIVALVTVGTNLNTTFTTIGGNLTR
ncbi:Flp family type IVb pilin [Falsiroseomonas sp. HW251]|uniref:Flp family type IVb pilin n=1 Tax=Falsiroseomonas sp. HW251 TaxID=3390998 RepID=UPI003D317AF1